MPRCEVVQDNQEQSNMRVLGKLDNAVLPWEIQSNDEKAHWASFTPLKG